MFTAAPHHDVLVVLVQIGALLLTGRLLGEGARRLGQPTVVGEIFAGIVLGPSLLSSLIPQMGAWLVPQTPVQGYLLEFISLIGVLFLLLVTGLEIDSRLMRRRAGAAFSVAIGGLILPLMAGFALGWVLPDRLLVQPDERSVFALFLATAMSISAIPVLAKVLMDLGLTRHNLGQTIIVAAMIDDTVGWTLLSVVAGLAAGGTLTLGSVLSSVAGVAAFLVFMFTIGRWLVGWAQRWVVQVHIRERGLSLIVVFMFGGAILSHAIGLEALLGAFVVGVLFNQMRNPDAIPDEAIHTLERMVMGVFAPIFFGVLGLKVNILTLFQQPDLLVTAGIVIAVATACKVIGVYAGARLLGKSDHWTALFYGAGLNARGSMEIIVASIGLSLGVLSQAMFSIIVVMAVVTSIMAPALLRWTFARIQPVSGG